MTEQDKTETETEQPSPSPSPSSTTEEHNDPQAWAAQGYTMGLCEDAEIIARLNREVEVMGVDMASGEDFTATRVEVAQQLPTPIHHLTITLTESDEGLSAETNPEEPPTFARLRLGDHVRLTQPTSLTWCHLPAGALGKVSSQITGVRTQGGADEVAVTFYLPIFAGIDAATCKGWVPRAALELVDPSALPMTEAVERITQELATSEAERARAWASYEREVCCRVELEALLAEAQQYGKDVAGQGLALSRALEASQAETAQVRNELAARTAAYNAEVARSTQLKRELARAIQDAPEVGQLLHLERELEATRAAAAGERELAQRMGDDAAAERRTIREERAAMHREAYQLAFAPETAALAVWLVGQHTQGGLYLVGLGVGELLGEYFLVSPKRAGAWCARVGVVGQPPATFPAHLGASPGAVVLGVLGARKANDARAQRDAMALQDGSSPQQLGAGVHIQMDASGCAGEAEMVSAMTASAQRLGIEVAKAVEKMPQH